MWECSRGGGSTVGQNRLGYGALGGGIINHTINHAVTHADRGRGLRIQAVVFRGRMCVSCHAWARHSPGIGVLGGLEMLRGAPTFGSGGLALGNVGERQPGELGMVWCAIRDFVRVFQ